MALDIFRQYKRLIIMLAFVIAIAWTLAGMDFFGEYTRIIISVVCGAGLIVFLVYYKEEAKPEQAKTTIDSQHRPLSPAPHAIPPHTKEIDVSKIIDAAHAHARGKEVGQEEDIFSGFK